MSKVAIQLLSWNGLKYLPGCLDSLFKQTYKDFSLYVLDNASQDGSLEWLKKEQQDGRYKFQLLVEEKNLGFAGGHNVLFTKHEAPYVLLLNQDIIFEPGLVEKLVRFMDEHPKVGAVGGVLYRWKRTPEEVPVVDSLGLKLLTNGRVIELGQGESATVVPASPRQIFGVSGALPLYRRASLDKLKAEQGEIFDGSFFAYKEDVDLAYRLRLAGFEAWLEPAAVGWHDRTIAGDRSLSDSVARKGRQGRHQIARFYSYRNHLLLLLKDTPLEVWRKTWYKIGWYELKKFFYLLILEPRTWWFGWRELGRLPELIRKRRQVQDNRRITPTEIWTWYQM